MESVKQTRISARKVVTPREILPDAVVEFSGGTVRIVETEGENPDSKPADVSGHLLIPGMIDLHVNGSGGGDAAEGTFEALEKMSRSLARRGCTGFLPTLITDHAPTLIERLSRLSAAMAAECPAAVPLGIHLEGPFLNPKRRGAHPEECIQQPDSARLQEFIRAAAGRLQMLTLAPEQKGGLELTRNAREHLPIVSIGHSNADYDTAVQAIAAGANLATHLYNAMPPLHHREPGLVAAILDSSKVNAEIIADGIHVHPAMIRLMAHCIGLERVILVTDAISAADMPDGTYRVGSVMATVHDGVCRVEDGRLAGSTLTMEAGLKNLVDWLERPLGANLSAIVSTATLQPAQLLGLEKKGAIRPGADADLVLLDERYNVQKTWVAGRLVYDTESGRLEV